jgi:hypothetical protein
MSHQHTQIQAREDLRDASSNLTDFFSGRTLT